MKTNVAQAQWARLLVGTLRRAGVRQAIVSPGSRSTPFLAALLDEPELRVHSVVDERSAAYVGVGLARACRNPVLLLCTSGTAAANYFPAIVEANQSCVPLLVLTADRPIEAQFAESPQTTDQVQMYGSHVRRYIELGEANVNGAALRSIRRLLVSAVHVAQSPTPGPVHLNARARKPLEPVAPDSAEAEALAAYVAELLEEPIPAPGLASAVVAAPVVRQFADTCVEAPKGLIACGYDPQWPELDADALADFSLATGYPVWLDVAHPLRWNPSPKLASRVLGCAHLVWGAPQIAAEWVPDMVVQVGPIQTSGHWEAWLERVGARRHALLARQGWPDPAGRAECVLVGDPSATLRHVTSTLAVAGKHGRAESPWFLACRRANALATSSLDTFLRQQVPPSELLAVRTVFEACPRGTRVVLGNSLPIRNADSVWPAAECALHAFAIRGTNGIDGVVSTAVGVALEGTAPVLVLVGDISFVHDLGALYAARSVKSPLAIVVIDNQGGRIFEQLPIGTNASPVQLEHWTTPHSLNLQAAGELFDIPVQAPTDLDGWRSAVQDALRQPRATLVYVRVDSASARQGTAELRRLVSVALAGSGKNA